MDLNDIMIPLGLCVLLVANIIAYYRRWYGPNAALDAALEAAEAGDTKDALAWLDRLMKGWQKKPDKWFSPMYVVSRMVVLACIQEWPETAQAVLVHLGMSRAELMWEEEGKPAIPLLEYVKSDPDFAEVVAFLEAEPKP